MLIFFSYNVIQNTFTKYQLYVMIIAYACLLVTIIDVNTKKIETFQEDTTSVQQLNNVFILPEFIEEMHYYEGTNEIKDQLIFYISTFSSTYVDINKKKFKNIVNEASDLKMVIPSTSDLTFNITQKDGLLIDHSTSYIMNSPGQLNFDFRKFSIVFYMKFNEREVKNNKVSTLLFIPTKDHRYEYNNNTLLQINIEHKTTDKLNPTFNIELFGNRISSSKHSDEYLLRNKLFFNDDKYHMFTLVRNENNSVKLYLDDNTEYPLLSETLQKLPRHDIKILEDDFIELNLIDKTTKPLNILLNVFGVYNKSLSSLNIIALNNYIEKTKTKFEPNYIEINNEREKYLKLYNKSTECPFNDKTICESKECEHVKDWSKTSEVLYNDKCFKQVIDYCDGLDNADNDKLCGTMNTNSVHRMALNLDYKDKLKKQESGKDDKELAKNIKNLGLNDIYLDKSIRQGGVNDEQMKGLVEQLLKTKDLTALNQLYDADTEKKSIYNNNTSHIDYSSLEKDDMSHNLMNFDEYKKQNKSDIKDNIVHESELIDINNNDIAKDNVYDNTINLNDDKTFRTPSYSSSKPLFDWFG